MSGCKRRGTGKVYACKAMAKRRIKAKNASDLCWNERVILHRVRSPFIISLKYAFQVRSAGSCCQRYSV